MGSRARQWCLRLLSAAAVTAVVIAVGILRPRIATTSGPTPVDFLTACDAGERYLVAANLYGVEHAGHLLAYDPTAPAVLLFTDTAADRPHYALATMAQVGAVFGLAYRKADESVYAAAYHKVQLPFGPGGPGAVYRIDLDTGDVTTAVIVPNAGDDRHELPLETGNKAAGPATSRTSLGDIDLSADGTQLFVTNLNDRRIYRFSLPSGDILGSFAHGAAGEVWAGSARPFALAWRDGYVYHGVVDSAEESGKADELRALVYRSRPDGSEMALVADIALGYRRGRLRSPASAGSDDLTWRPWRDNYEPLSHSGDRSSVYPMPLLTDIDFDLHDNTIVGLRDRHSDNMTVYARDYGLTSPTGLRVGFGVGDLLYGHLDADTWAFDTSDEHFDDAVARPGDQSVHGGLAELPDDLTVTGSYVVNGGEVQHGATWFDNEDGSRRALEQFGHTLPVEPYRAAAVGVSPVFAHDESGLWIIRSPGTVGDVEVLCAPDVVPTLVPTPVPTSTPAPTQRATPPASASPRPPTATIAATATPMPTSTSTPTATPVPVPLYLPVALRERCDPEHKRADVALVIDTSSSMAGRKLEDAKSAAAAFVAQMDLSPARDQVAVVRYDTEAEVACQLTTARAVIEAAIRNLTSRSGTHIDKGLRTALAELLSPRHVERNLPVIVLLTDGIQTGTPGQEIVAAAEVRDAGVRFYTSGLGSDVDAATLREMADDERRYHFAPDSTDLARIYGEIASDILCPAPVGGFWPGG